MSCGTRPARVTVPYADTGFAKGTFGSGSGVLNARWRVGSVPSFQLRCGTPAGKTISDQGVQSCCLPSISMLIVPRRM
jgi:hypothetical protein